MAEHPMETTFRTALWRQFGAAIDMLENACWPVPARIGMHASGAIKNNRITQPSGISPIIPSSGSTCISQAKQKDSLPLRTSGTRLTQKVNFPNNPIPGMSSTPI